MTVVPDPPEDPPFSVRSRVAEGTAVVALEGDLDVVSAPEAAEALRAAQAGGSAVVLDLRALRFMDSSGLRVVLEAQRRAAGAGDGTALRIAAGEGEVRRVFELSGVGALVTFVDAPPPKAGG